MRWCKNIASPAAMRLLGVVFVGSLLTACGASTRSPTADVWDQYDIRVPLPANSRVPTVSGEYWQNYDPYRVNNTLGSGGYPVDNDAYYLPPINDINSETYD